MMTSMIVPCTLCSLTSHGDINDGPSFHSLTSHGDINHSPLYTMPSHHYALTPCMAILITVSCDNGPLSASQTENHYTSGFEQDKRCATSIRDEDGLNSNLLSCDAEDSGSEVTREMMSVLLCVHRRTDTRIGAEGIECEATQRMMSVMLCARTQRRYEELGYSFLRCGRQRV